METLSDSQKTQLETVNGLENKLVWAIYKGTPDAVEHFIEQGANVNWTDADGMIPLYKSGRDGKHEALEILIQHGANMEHDGDRGSTALYVAAQNGHSKCVEVLLKYGAYLESKFTGFYTPVYIASQKGFRTIVELLIAHGANLEAPCPNGSTALFVASQNGHAKVVELLLANGANTEILFKAKTTPLEQAAGRGHKECVQLLLQYGAHFDPKKPETPEEERPKKFVYCRKVLADPKHPRPVKVLLAVDTTLYIAYAGEKNVIAFDTLSDQPVASFDAHLDEVTCLATQGDILYSGSADKSIMCWDKNTGELLDTIKGHTEAITCILYHTYVEKDKQNFEVTRKILYSGSADKTVRGWEGNIRKVKFEGHKGPITCIYAKNFKIYSMSYDILYSASADGTVRANDIVTGQCLLEFIGHDGAILTMAEHDDLVYTGSADNTIKCWDRLRGKCLHTFEGHTDSIRTMQIVDCILFTGSSDKTVKAWGARTKKLHGSYEGHGGSITCSTISKDTLYTGSSDGTIRFWELGDKAHYIVGEKSHVYEHATQDEIIHVKLVNDVLYTASQCELRAWDTKKNSLISSVKFPVDGISCLSVNPPKNKFFTGGSNQIISIWNLQTGEFISKIPVLSPITCMLVPDDNNSDDQLYTGFADSTVKSWDIGPGKCLVNFVGHTSRVNCIQVRESLLYTGSDDMTVRTWKRKTGELVQDFQADDCVSCIAVDAELLFASVRNTIIGWSLKTRKHLSYAFEGHTKPVTCLCVQGDTLLSGSADKTIRKWDKKTGEVFHVFRGNNGIIGCMDVTNELVYSGASDGTVSACIHKDDKLFWACHYGITAVVKEAIEQDGKELTARDSLDRTLLMIACAEGHTRLAEYLLAEGCNFEIKNSRDQTALYFILKNHRWHLLHHLSNFFQVKFGTPLPLLVIPSTACEALLRERCTMLDKEFFRNLQKHCVDFDSSHIVGYAASLGLIEMVKFFIDEFKFDVTIADREGKTLMQNATEHSQPDVVNFLNKFSQDISTLPDSQKGGLTVLLEEQAKEFAKICENFQQMQRLFSSMQYSINTVVKNQEHISQLLRQPK